MSAEEVKANPTVQQPAASAMQAVTGYHVTIPHWISIGGPDWQGVGLMLGMAVFVIAICSLFAWSKLKWGRQRLEEYFNKLADERITHLEAVVEDSRRELALREEIRILVLQPDKPKTEFVQKIGRRYFPKSMKFEALPSDAVDWKIPDWQQFDIILFDQASGLNMNYKRGNTTGKRDGFLREFNDKFPTHLFLHFGDRIESDEIPSGMRDRLTFTNAEPQLFPNLMNLIRYRSIINPKS